MKRLLSPEYWVVSEPGPLGTLWALYAALGVFFALVVVYTLWLLAQGRWNRPISTGQKTWAGYEFWVCLAGLGTVIGRFLGWPGWSARIWPTTLAFLSIAGFVAYGVRRRQLPPWLATQFRLLTFSSSSSEELDSMATSRRTRLLSLLLGLLVHGLGLCLVLNLWYRLPLWLGPLVLACLLLPQIPLLAHSQPIRLMALTPLVAIYAAVMIWSLYGRLHITVVGWQGLAFPNPFTSLFYVDGIVVASAVYVYLIQLRLLLRQFGKPGAFGQWTALLLVAATVFWAGAVYLGKRTSGVTASDPYAYAQMGVDLAQNSSFVHRFDLFQEVLPLGISWAPTQPVGYHIPRNVQGDSPSVWATGASALLAAAYKLMGEQGLYVAIPLVALAALAAGWALVQEILHKESRSIRYLTGALTVALLATSPEYVDRALVPMADAPAQLFTTLALFFLLRGMRQTRAGQAGISFLLAGACFGWAYWVRHTQLVLALPALLAVTLRNRSLQPLTDAPAPFHSQDHLPRLSSGSPSRKLAAAPILLVFFGAALLAAAPDIAYRWRWFGSPLAVETTELHLMGIRHIGPVAWEMLRTAVAAGEWGYLVPFAVYGGYRLAHDHSREASLLTAGFLAVLLAHLTYRSLRLRDLISLFPVVNVAVAYGAITLMRRVRPSSPAQGARVHRLGAVSLAVVAVTWIMLSLGLARWTMAGAPWRPGWASFGYVTPEQRAAFDRLSELTPDRSVIGASLNAGAITLYSARDAFRPYDGWTGEEWTVFVEAMKAHGRPIYLLDDGASMAGFIAGERRFHSLTPIELVNVPLFHGKVRATGWLYRVEWDK